MSNGDRDARNEAEAMFETLGLCGCGNPEWVHAFLLACLSEQCDDRGIIDSKKVAALVRENAEAVAELVLLFLHSHGLTEHGSSVHGSWLTERGRHFLEAGDGRG
jgi:hypothetical protein